jgi:O-antigen/teichoic acid export membrane protein
MNPLRRAIKNTIALSLADVGSKVFNFIFLAVLARQLTQHDFGGYSIVVTLIAFMGPFADFGISQVLIREIAIDRHRAGKLFFNALLITLGLSCLAWIILTGIAVLSSYPVELRPLIILSGISVIGNTVMLTAGSVLRGYERMEIQGALASVILFFSSLAGIAASLSGLGIDVQIGLAVLFSVIGAMTVLFVVHRQFAPLRWDPDPELCRSLVRQAAPVMVFIIFSILLHWGDVLILGLVNSMSEVAVYSAAIKIIDVAGIISISAAAALFPALSAAWRESVDAALQLYVQCLRFFAAFGIGIAITVTVLAEPLAVTIFGELYKETAISLRILGWAFFFTTVNGPIGALLIASADRLHKYMLTFALVVAANIGLNFLLAPYWGAIGASIAFIITAAAAFFLRQIVAAGFFPQPPRIYLYLWRPALAAIAMGLCLELLSSQSLFISLPAGWLIFVVFLGALGELKKEPYREMILFTETVWKRIVKA